MSKFMKREVSLRYWLQGAGYFRALEAMEFAKGFHTGVRKDGVTPEFDHQLSIGQYVRTLFPGLTHPEDTIATVFLHDIREDYGVGADVIESRFGTMVSAAVEAMTKEFRGVKKDIAWTFRDISENDIASIAKGADRIHNFSSMVGVFSIPKQKEYIKEGKDWFLPMLKSARRRFPQQEPAYENIKMVLLSQMNLIEAIHEGKG